MKAHRVNPAAIARIGGTVVPFRPPAVQPKATKPPVDVLQLAARIMAMSEECREALFKIVDYISVREEADA